MSGGGIIHVYHLYTKNKSEKRLDEEIINRIRVMPFIPAIIENRDKEKTAVVSIRENKFNPQNKDYELISKVNVHGEERFVSVILTDSDRYFRDKQENAVSFGFYRIIKQKRGTVCRQTVVKVCHHAPVAYFSSRH